MSSSSIGAGTDYTPMSIRNWLQVLKENKRNVEVRMVRRFLKHFDRVPFNLDKTTKRLRPLDHHDYDTDFDTLVDLIWMYSVCINNTKEDTVIKLKKTIDVSQTVKRRVSKRTSKKLVNIEKLQQVVEEEKEEDGGEEEEDREEEEEDGEEGYLEGTQQEILQEHIQKKYDEINALQEELRNISTPPDMVVVPIGSEGRKLTRKHIEECLKTEDGQKLFSTKLYFQDFPDCFSKDISLEQWKVIMLGLVYYGNAFLRYSDVFFGVPLDNMYERDFAVYLLCQNLATMFHESDDDRQQFTSFMIMIYYCGQGETF